MARYLVECTHTPEDCVRALDSVVALSHELMHRFDWGCKDDDHTGWAVVEAKDKDTALMLMPTYLRDKTRVVGLVKFTPEDVKSFHEPHS